MIEDYQEFMQRRKAIREKNEALIAEWQSIPWWKFWAKKSFEEKRDIIIRNWSKV